MEELSDSDGGDKSVTPDINPIMKTKTRTSAQIESFKKAQTTRIENAKLRKEKLEEMKNSIKIDQNFTNEEKEESGLTKLQREKSEIEKRIMMQVKDIQDKKNALKEKKAEKKAELRAKEKQQEDIKELQQKYKNKSKADAEALQKQKNEVHYESEEEVVIIKKKKKQPKIIYESESEEEELPVVKKTKHAEIVKEPAAVVKSTIQPQIIKTNQIRFF